MDAQARNSKVHVNSPGSRTAAQDSSEPAEKAELQSGRIRVNAGETDGKRASGQSSLYTQRQYRMNIIWRAVVDLKSENTLAGMEGSAQSKHVVCDGKMEVGVIQPLPSWLRSQGRQERRWDWTWGTKPSVWPLPST